MSEFFTVTIPVTAALVVKVQKRTGVSTPENALLEAILEICAQPKHRLPGYITAGSLEFDGEREFHGMPNCSVKAPGCATDFSFGNESFTPAMMEVYSDAWDGKLACQQDAHAELAHAVEAEGPISGPRIIATFHPQGWQRNYAIGVDPEGPVHFDVTDQILAMPQEQALAIQDDQYESDALREHQTVPPWIRNWSGPFYVEVAQSIQDYFYEQDRTSRDMPLPAPSDEPYTSYRRSLINLLIADERDDLSVRGARGYAGLKDMPLDDLIRLTFDAYECASGDSSLDAPSPTADAQAFMQWALARAKAVPDYVAQEDPHA